MFLKVILYYRVFYFEVSFRRFEVVVLGMEKGRNYIKKEEKRVGWNYKFLKYKFISNLKVW